MNSVENSNNKRIAKNTILLYLRMIITTLVSLYTARVLLTLLGAEDFGIYNVVGGVVTFMSFINGTMTSATQRFLAFDLGKNDIGQYRRTYSMIINVFILLCLLLFVLLEAFGPWVVTKLNIAASRMDAAQIVFQFSLLTFILSTLCIPFQSSIIAYEKMGVYAYLTLIDVIAKLLICFILYVTTADGIVVYATFNMIVSLIILLVYYLYCRKRLPGCIYSFHWDTSLFSRLSKYAGWNLFGSISNILCLQGQAILLNIFFGPIVNTAKAIADRIHGIIMTFSTNFYMAVAPQIIKTYAAGQIDYTRKLVTNSSRYSFYLLSIVSLPLIYNMENILQLWLGDSQVTFVMIRFAQWELIKSLVFVLENPITMAVRATGDIKKYQVSVGVQTLMFLPLCYIAFLHGIPAYYSMIILTLLLLVVQVTRVLLVRKIIHITIAEYSKEVVLPIITTIIISGILSYYAVSWDGDSLLSAILKMAVVFLIVFTTVSTIGLRQQERIYIYNIVKNRLTHRYNDR